MAALAVMWFREWYAAINVMTANLAHQSIGNALMCYGAQWQQM